MVSRNLPNHKTIKCTGKRQDHAHECSNTFMRRRGAWFLETFPVTRCRNTYEEGLHTTNKSSIHAFVKGVVHEHARNGSQITRHMNTQKEGLHTRILGERKH